MSESEVFSGSVSTSEPYGAIARRSPDGRLGLLAGWELTRCRKDVRVRSNRNESATIIITFPLLELFQVSKRSMSGIAGHSESFTMLSRCR